MSTEDVTKNIAAASPDDIMWPLVVLRTAEYQHRHKGGGRPDCIKLSPDFYDRFMQSYRHCKAMLRARHGDEVADQIDIENPYILGIRIICDPGAADDIVFNVPPAESRIIVASSFPPA